MTSSQLRPCRSVTGVGVDTPPIEVTGNREVVKPGEPAPIQLVTTEMAWLTTDTSGFGDKADIVQLFNSNGRLGMIVYSSLPQVGTACPFLVATWDKVRAR